MNLNASISAFHKLLIMNLNDSKTVSLNFYRSVLHTHLLYLVSLIEKRPVLLPDPLLTLLTAKACICTSKETLFGRGWVNYNYQPHPGVDCLKTYGDSADYLNLIMVYFLRTCIYQRFRTANYLGLLRKISSVFIRGDGGVVNFFFTTLVHDEVLVLSPNS